MSFMNYKCMLRINAPKNLNSNYIWNNKWQRGYSKSNLPPDAAENSKITNQCDNLQSCSSWTTVFTKSTQIWSSIWVRSSLPTPQSYKLKKRSVFHLLQQGLWTGGQQFIAYRHCGWVVSESDKFTTWMSQIWVPLWPIAGFVQGLCSLTAYWFAVCHMGF